MITASATNDYDVIVIGGGGAGLAAANSVVSAGKTALVIEASTRLGGSTALSGGSFYAAGTSVQREKGVIDDAAAMIRFALTLNQFRVEPSLVRRYSVESSEALSWLIEKGVEYPSHMLDCYDVSGVARTHFPIGFGSAVITALDAALDRSQADVALDTRVQDLVVEDGTAIGVTVNGIPVRASSVIITTGGFGANPALIAKHFTSAARQGDSLWYMGSDFCRGDGLLMGQSLDAAVAGHDRGLLLPSPGFLKIVELIPAWLTLVNVQGRRFMNESIAYGLQFGLVDSQPDGIAYGIFDHSTFTTPPRDKRNDSVVGREYMTTAWVSDVLADNLATGRIISADSIRALASKLGIDSSALEVTIAQQNQAVANGTDTLFDKARIHLHPVTKGPYYAVRFIPDVLGLTGTGLRIDTDARVIGTNGMAIPGLFAAGEVVGGLMGTCYIGTGSSVGSAITFGRVAGRSAAANAG